MISHFRFASLAGQVADALRREIESGMWSDMLPGERPLTERLQVSRKTLRKALAQLQSEEIIRAVHGVGNRILAKNVRPAVAASPNTTVVGLLTPDPLDQMRPYTSLWVNHLKSLLGEKNARLRTFDGRKYFSSNPDKALAKLATQNAATCWLLANSNEATQRWFATQKISCVIAGSCHSGVDLPQVDLDHYALCRHAAGVLLGAGHRRVALLNERSGRAGDLESEAGFIAGVRESPHVEAVPLIVHHEHSPVSLKRALERLIGNSSPPTALLVSNGASYLTVVSALAQHGLRVPQDVSVVSRDDEPFLSFVVPTPTRYATNPRAFAKKILKPVMQYLNNDSPQPRTTRILPSYSKGGSLGPPHRNDAA